MSVADGFLIVLNNWGVSATRDTAAAATAACASAWLLRRPRANQKPIGLGGASRRSLSIAHRCTGRHGAGHGARDKPARRPRRAPPCHCAGDRGGSSPTPGCPAQPSAGAPASTTGWTGGIRDEGATADRRRRPPSTRAVSPRGTVIRADAHFPSERFWGDLLVRTSISCWPSALGFIALPRTISLAVSFFP